jgi:hypothetical protein
MEKQAVSCCPLCDFDVVVSTFLVKKGDEVVHTEFSYKCFRCGWGRCSPEEFL